MIELFLKYAADPTIGSELSVVITNLMGSAGQGNADLVEMTELRRVRGPSEGVLLRRGRFRHAPGWTSTWHAGRFETPSIAELPRHQGDRSDRRKPPLVGTRRSQSGDRRGRPASDGVPPRSLFQAASQFNCLESPGPYVTPVVEYFRDRTQGPGALILSISRDVVMPLCGSEERRQTICPDGRRSLDLLTDVLARVSSS